MDFLKGTYGFDLLSIVLILLSFILNVFDITRILGLLMLIYAIYRAFSKKIYKRKEEYNVFYLSHGGWSNETTLMGTDDNPKSFKNVIDNAIQDGNIKPLIIVLPTYNNTSENDSSDYSLAI